jgi:DNA repair protein RadD
MIELRGYQDVLVSGARAEIARGNRAVLMVAPTGAGKTVMAAYIVQRAAQRGLRTWFIVHRRELLQQSSRTFDAVGVEHGICSAGFSRSKSLVQICGVQSLVRRLDDLPEPDMIIWDEAHHIASESWSKIYSRFPSAIHLGLTATPTRLDGTGLRAWFSAMVTGPTTQTLIEAGMLSPFKLFAPSIPDMAGTKTRAGDYVKEEVESRMDRPSVTGDAVAHYQRLSGGQRAIAFCASVKHSQHVVEAFRASGIQAAHLDGSTPKNERDAMLASFKRGDIKVISNVDLFGEGFDVPAIEAAILLRPTQSLSLYLQQVGRALRTHAGKTHATILDHAGNCFRHGLPTDSRDWSLDSIPKTKSEREKPAAVRQCKQCFAAFSARIYICPVCGKPVETVSREIAQVAGQLSEVTAVQRVEKKREQAGAKTMQDLVSLAIARKYKNPSAWAYHVFNARQRRA